jgi:cold shock CspA family protein
VGVVKWFDAQQRGLGFITPSLPLHADVFVHINEVRRSGIVPDDLMPGKRVEYSISGDRSGRETAVELTLLLD